jgi:hypothetical protein
MIDEAVRRHVPIDGESYRAKEANEYAQQRAKQMKSRRTS